MSKSFRDTYNSESFDIKRIDKSHKQKRQRVKGYLRRIDIDNMTEDDEEFDELNETLEEDI